MPVPVAALIAGGSALASGIQAARQKKAADKIKVGTEVISEEQKKALAMLKAKQGQGFAGKAQTLELAGASGANTLGLVGPGGRNTALIQQSINESNLALKLAKEDADANKDADADYIAGLGEMGKDKQTIQQKKIAAAKAAKAALFASSQANFSNATTAAAGAVDTLSANKANQTA